MSGAGNGGTPPTVPAREVRLPDLGTTTEVTVVEWLVKVGDQVEKDTPLVTLESDKASMDIPSPAGGRVARIIVQPGAKVRTGMVILELEGELQAVAEQLPPHRR